MICKKIKKNTYFFLYILKNKYKNMKNIISYNNFVNESKLQNDYRDFFSKMLEIYGVKSPSEFKNDKSKAEKFYDDIKKGWNNGEGISQYGKELIEKGKKIDESKNYKSNDININKNKIIKESNYTTPSELWDDSISKFLDICNNYPEINVDIISSNIIKVDCKNSDLIDELIAEFEQINPEYVCDYDPVECQITIEEK